MKRPFKFRVWSTQLNKFLTRDEWYFDFDGNIKFIDLCPESTDGECSPLINQDLFIIQQYTGLKDKNDKEIYEGDILKFVTKIKDWDNFVGEVFYWDEEACFYHTFLEGRPPKRMWGFGSQYESKIIGNIFENPNLLK